MDKTPTPGSKEAIEQGCICPVMDNNYGEGYMGQEGVFIYSTGCPVHGELLKDIKEEEH